jgi:hypothetical protein
MKPLIRNEREQEGRASSRPAAASGTEMQMMKAPIVEKEVVERSRQVFSAEVRVEVLAPLGSHADAPNGDASLGIDRTPPKVL